MPDLPSQNDVLQYFASLSNWGRWGKDDQLGTMNHITPETRRRAVSLVEEGVTVSCSRPLSNAPGPDVSGTAGALHDRVGRGLCPR